MEEKKIIKEFTRREDNIILCTIKKIFLKKKKDIKCIMYVNKKNF
jgi:hypothetical protein